MNRLLLFILYIVGLVCVMQGWLFFGAVAAVVFSFFAPSVWLLPAAFLIDGYFGVWYSVPFFSIVTFFWFVVIEFLRPYVSVWQNETV
ncbi:hypothetical protein CL638_00885 [bacterium]|nr:hypothetical protein [bacterium]